jgi:hypothetical protein
MNQLVAFAGLKRVGKDTAGAVLVGEGYVKVAFADPLKTMMISLLTIRGASHSEIIQMVEGDLKEVPSDYLSGRSARYAMQTLGTEWGREIMANDFWIDAFNNRIALLKAAGKKVVVTDVRFDNEADAVRAQGGLVVHIDRPRAGYLDPHKSEAPLMRLAEDMVLENKYSTRAQFENMVRYIFTAGKD